MTETKKIINRILEFLKTAGWTRYKLAREAGLHANTLNKVKADDFNPTADTLKKCEKVINREEKR